MTNEEIIKGLQATNEHIGKHFNEDGAWMAEFIDNAIKELETVSCIKEKCAYCPHCENCDVDDETLEIKALESHQNLTNEEMYQQLIHLEAENERLHDALESQPQFYIPCVDCNTKMDGVQRAHDNLSKQRWIPVNEPPKKNGEYLVILIDEDSDSDDIFVVDKAYWTGMNWTYKFLMVENVIAYKTLPEPCRAESEEEEC